MKDIFRRLAQTTYQAAGSSWSFILATLRRIRRAAAENLRATRYVTQEELSS